jgi:tRNA threonylcarbamoyladenosine biosynthesis protein TsaE
MKNKLKYNLSDISNVSKKIFFKYKDKKVFLLFGDIGSGKTTFVGSVLRSVFDFEGEIASPTFSYVNRYFVEKNEHKIESIFHWDLYRILTEKDLDKISFSELIETENSRHFIEWPEKISMILPNNISFVELKLMGKEETERDIYY